MRHNRITEQLTDSSRIETELLAQDYDILDTLPLSLGMNIVPVLVQSDFRNKDGFGLVLKHCSICRDPDSDDFLIVSESWRNHTEETGTDKWFPNDIKSRFSPHLESVSIIQSEGLLPTVIITVNWNHGKICIWMPKNLIPSLKSTASADEAPAESDTPEDASTAEPDAATSSDASNTDSEQPRT